VEFETDAKTADFGSKRSFSFLIHGEMDPQYAGAYESEFDGSGARTTEPMNSNVRWILERRMSAIED
jgi:hypothetical protein